MNYKKIIKSQELRFKILHCLDWVPDSVMLRIQYYIKMDRWPNFKHPQRWTEKLQVYKMYYRNNAMPQCVDKYDAREYVANKGLKENLVELYGVWNSPDEIDFDNLPQQFVIKTTDGGGGLNVILIRDKSKSSISEIKEKLGKWTDKKRGVSSGREWAYTGIKQSRIIAEQLLVNKGHPEAGVEDFKILCFHGEPKYVIVDKDRYTDHHRNFYNTKWERVNVTTDHEQFETPYPCPKNFEVMLQVARRLSEDFPFVRVDLYNVEGKVYFGELTFYPWTGYVQFKPDSFDFELGAMMDCSQFMPA